MRELKDQIDYYQARADEYDQWWKRKGRYDRGVRLNNQWFDEVNKLKEELKRFNPAGKVLELACGTGWWTKELVRYAKHVTAIDASSEVIAINKTFLKSSKVTYTQADVFKWRTTETYDVIFFSFWLSHVPLPLFESFWKLVKRSLKLNGRVFFIDSLNNEGFSKKLETNKGFISERTLNNGKKFRIIKIFYQPNKLIRRLKKLGWNLEIKHTKEFFLYGYGGLSDKPISN